MTVAEIDAAGSDLQEGGHIFSCDGAAAQTIGDEDDDVVFLLCGRLLWRDGGTKKERKDAQAEARGRLHGHDTKAYSSDGTPV